MYNTCKSQVDDVVLEVPNFTSLIFKSTMHFGLSCANDAPVIWNNLPDNVYSATSLSSIRKKLKSYLFAKHTNPSFLFLPQVLSGLVVSKFGI